MKYVSKFGDDYVVYENARNFAPNSGLGCLVWTFIMAFGSLIGLGLLCGGMYLLGFLFDTFCA